MDCENRPIFIYPLLIHIKVHSKPMQRSPQHHKDMPDKVQLITTDKIIRTAYKSLVSKKEYIEREER